MYYRLTKRFGARIRQLRLQKKLTQERLADRAGLHVTFVSLVERGRHNANLKTINKLSKGLKVPVWEIFIGMERARDLPKYEQLRLKGFIRKGPGKPPLVDEKGRRIRPIRSRARRKTAAQATGKAKRKP